MAYGIEDPDANSCTYGDLTFDKDRNIQHKKNVSSTNGAGLTRCLHVEKYK